MIRHQQHITIEQQEHSWCSWSSSTLSHPESKVSFRLILNAQSAEAILTILSTNIYVVNELDRVESHNLEGTLPFPISSPLFTHRNNYLDYNQIGQRQTSLTNIWVFEAWLKRISWFSCICWFNCYSILHLH